MTAVERQIPLDPDAQAQERARAKRDRQELWWLDNFLAVNATTDAQRARQQRLHRYLCETCPHEWADVSGWGGTPQGTKQCSWCSHVLMPGDAT